MEPGPYNLKIYRGRKYDTTFDLGTGPPESSTPVNLTGATAAFNIYETRQTRIPTLTLTQTAGITLGGTAGTVRVQIAKTTTESLPFVEGWYTLDISDEPWLEGKCSVRD